MKSDSISKANATCQQKGIDAVFHQFLGRINLKRFEIGFWFLRLSFSIIACIIIIASFAIALIAKGFKRLTPSRW
jgi:hypothetical protein